MITNFTRRATVASLTALTLTAGLVPLREIIVEIWPFLAVLIVALLLMHLFPDVVLWLPRVFGYQG